MNRPSLVYMFQQIMGGRERIVNFILCDES